jgi:CheY-like chemotaxis protein
MPHLRVLVVDDCRDADSMATLLEWRGHEVRVAYNGQRALEVCREFHPEVILLDLVLPGLSGYALAKQLRCERALLVAVTGYGQQEDIRRSHEAGFDAHLLKPIELDQLYALLERGCHGTAGPSGCLSSTASPDV